MRRCFFIFFIFQFIYVVVDAQVHDGVVKGKVVDSLSNEPLQGASILIKRANDSIIISSSISTNEGMFGVKNLDSGEYDLFISFQGYDPLKRRFMITEDSSTLDLRVMQLVRAVQTMQEVVINDRIPVRIKGDTVFFNAESYKTRINASAEDLLKKLPGMEVQRDGTIKAQGDEVQKIYVDGKEFFGNDPSQAAQNLTADMIDRVELYNERSEQSQFSGMDDGSRAKVINLKLKKSKKNGLTGKGYIGLGSDNRYETGLNANYFKAATRIAVTARSNNINATGPVASSAGTGRNNVTGIGFRPGLNRASQLGTTYNDIWGNKLESSMSYSFKNLENINDMYSRRQIFFPDSSVIRNQIGRFFNTSKSHSLQFKFNFMIDSQNSILYTPSLTYQSSQLRRIDSTETFAVGGTRNRKVNDSRSVTDNQGNGVVARHNLLYRRRFQKNRRTFSAGLVYLSSQNDRIEKPLSRIGQYRNGDKLTDRVIQQGALQEIESGNSRVTVSYTEPIGNNQLLELNYQHINQRNRSDRTTYDRDHRTGSNGLDSLEQTSFFRNRVATDRFGTSFRLGNQKSSIQVGLALQQTILQTNNLSKGTANRQKFIAILPNAYFNQQIGRGKNLQITYNGYAAQPSSSQMQEVVNKSFPLYWTAGNPEVKQEFSNSFSVVYNSFNLNTYSTFFFTASISNTYNKIVNNVLSKPELIRNAGLLSFDDSIPQGVQLFIPVNANGSYNVMGHMSLSTPFRKWEGSHISTVTTFIYSRDVSLADDRRNFTHNLILGQDLKLNVRQGEALEVELKGGIQYSGVKNTLQPEKFPPFVLYSGAANFILNLPGNLMLSTELDYRVNTGMGEAYNQNFLLWNAGLSKNLFKNKKSEIRLRLFDLLNKNQSVIRSVSNNSIEDTRNTALGRYALLSFVYHLSTSFNKKSN